MYSSLRNQFISYVDVRTPLKTVWKDKHGAVAKRGPLKVVSHEHMYCHVVHERNILRKAMLRKFSRVKERKWVPAESVPAPQEFT